MASNFSFSNDAKNSADLKKNQNTPPKQILFRTSFSSKYLNQKRKWIRTKIIHYLCNKFICHGCFHTA